MIQPPKWNAFRSYKDPRNKTQVFGIIAISKMNRVLLVKGRERNKWSFPKGHIKKNETSYQCALRECYEETGIHFDTILYNDSKKLYSGEYYIYKNLEEFSPDIRDTSEIMEANWFSIPEILDMKNNIDVNHFLNIHKNYITN